MKGQHTFSSVLTDTEVRHAKLIADGKSSKEIAAELNLSTKTTETHRANIYKKLGVTKAPQLVWWLVVNGLYAYPDNNLTVPSLYDAAKRDFERLLCAVKRIYFTAHWSPDRRVLDASALWADLRDAAGIEPGEATRILGTPFPELPRETVYVVEEYRSGKVWAVFSTEALARGYAATREGTQVVAWMVHQSMETMRLPRPFSARSESIVPRPTPEADDALGAPSTTFRRPGVRS